MAIVSRTNNISVMYIRNFLAMYDNLDAECLDVGTLCTKANNQWSKYKPVRFPQIDVTAYPNWYRAFDGSCGLDIKTYTTMSAMFTALRGGTFGWSYIKPNGGDTAPYRLLDFMNYDTEAQPPISANTLAAKYYKTNSTAGVSANVNTPGATELSLSDLGNAINLGNCYFGAAISKVGTTTYQRITETSTITGGGGGGVDIPISGLDVGNYNVVMFLGTSASATLTSSDAGSYVPIPFPIQTIEIALTDFLVNFGSNTYWDANKTYWEMVFVNESGGVRQLNGCNIRIKYADNKTGPEQSGETSFEIHTDGSPAGVILVPAHTTITLTGTVFSSLPLYDAPDNRGGWIFFSNTSNSLYNTDTEIGPLN